MKCIHFVGFNLCFKISLTLFDNELKKFSIIFLDKESFITEETSLLHYRVERSLKTLAI